MSQEKGDTGGRLVAVVGPTACGKTTFAAHLALALDGEILSADSRQVYRRMTIGTGKDLGDYEVGGRKVPYHLVDIVEPGEKYNVYRFQTDFAEAYLDVVGRGRTPIMCGGSGLYVEAVLKNYSLLSVPPNAALRAELEALSMEDLAARLATYQELHDGPGQPTSDGSCDRDSGLLEPSCRRERAVGRGGGSSLRAGHRSGGAQGADFEATARQAGGRNGRRGAFATGGGHTGGRLDILWLGV